MASSYGKRLVFRGEEKIVKTKKRRRDGKKDVAPERKVLQKIAFRKMSLLSARRNEKLKTASCFSFFRFSDLFFTPLFFVYSTPSPVPAMGISFSETYFWMTFGCVLACLPWGLAFWRIFLFWGGLGVSSVTPRGPWGRALWRFSSGWSFAMPELHPSN